MSSLTSSEILQFNLNDSTLDLLNAAIASHQAKLDTTISQPMDLLTNKSLSTNDESAATVHVHTKRELEKDDQTTTTAPKRAGRKPLDKSQIPDVSLDPKQKRKAQNRAAQRAFRDRKEKYVSELQTRIEELEALNATKDEDLISENKRLKEELQKLQEENYALKGAQFTFEFPLNDTINTLVNKSPNDINTYQTSTSYSEDASSSTEQSPLTNSHTHEDDSTSSDTPITSNHVSFSIDPLQFDLSQPITTNQNNFDFLAVKDVSSLNDPSAQANDSLPQGDLFHGKDDLFANYRIPTNTTVDDFLFANEDLTNLFGVTDDLFGFNSQFGLPETPAIQRLNLPVEKREQMLEKLKQAQQQGKYVYQGYQDMKQSCPDFDLDLLCDELKQKAQCSRSTFPITDTEVNAFMRCLERHSTN